MVWYGEHGDGGGFFGVLDVATTKAKKWLRFFVERVIYLAGLLRASRWIIKHTVPKQLRIYLRGAQNLTFPPT